MSYKMEINPYHTNCLILKMSSAAYIQVHFRLDFIMDPNAMHPDQTAPKYIVCKIGT